MNKREQKSIQQQERVLWQGRSNLVGFILPNIVSLMLTAMWAYLFINVNSNVLNRGLLESSAIQFFALSPLLISSGIFLKKMTDYLSMSITLTDQKLVLRMAGKLEEIHLDHITRAEVTISPFDEVFGSGSITILQKGREGGMPAVRTLYSISQPNQFLHALEA